MTYQPLPRHRLQTHEVRKIKKRAITLKGNLIRRLWDMTWAVSSGDAVKRLPNQHVGAFRHPAERPRKESFIRDPWGPGHWHGGDDDCVGKWRIRIISLMSAHVTQRGQSLASSGHKWLGDAGGDGLKMVIKYLPPARDHSVKHGMILPADHVGRILVRWTTYHQQLPRSLEAAQITHLQRKMIHAMSI